MWILGIRRRQIPPKTKRITAIIINRKNINQLNQFLVTLIILPTLRPPTLQTTVHLQHPFSTRNKKNPKHAPSQRKVPKRGPNRANLPEKPKNAANFSANQPNPGNRVKLTRNSRLRIRRFKTFWGRHFEQAVKAENFRKSGQLYPENDHFWRILRRRRRWENYWNYFGAN